MAAPMSCTSQSVFCCILRNFAFAGRCVTPPMDHGSMSRLMFGLTLTSNLATTQDEAEDEAEVFVLCCQKRSTITVCGECEEHYCAECIDTHACGVKYNTNDIWS